VSEWDKLQTARDFLAKRVPKFPRLAVVLGSGLGGALNAMQVRAEIPFSEIPGVRASTVQGHSGKLVIGDFHSVPVACFQGRIHSYEGLLPAEVVFPFRVAALLGTEVFLLTNAAGGVHPDMKPMDLVLIRDHINLMGVNPLTGPNDPRLGERFPDMTHAYDPELCRLIHEAGVDAQVALREGVYVGISGPSYETPAEIRMYRSLGGDVVGMSTVPEVIALRHMKKRVAAISCVTNLAAGVGSEALAHSEVLEAGAQVEGRFARLMESILTRFEREGVL